MWSKRRCMCMASPDCKRHKDSLVRCKKGSGRHGQRVAAGKEESHYSAHEQTIAELS